MSEKKNKSWIRSILLRILLVCLGICVGAIWSFIVGLFFYIGSSGEFAIWFLMVLPVFGGAICGFLCGYLGSKVGYTHYLALIYFALITIIVISIGIFILYQLITSDWGN